jgi:hypothetical protein
MGRAIDFLIGALCCYIAILFYLDVKTQTAPVKEVVTIYNSESECNKDTGLDCYNRMIQFYSVSK